MSRVTVIVKREIVLDVDSALLSASGDDQVRVMTREFVEGWIDKPMTSLFRPAWTKAFRVVSDKTAREVLR